MAKAHIGSENQKKFFFDIESLTRHAAILGTTGSGKTVMGKVIIEEALSRSIPVIAIDPKGDLGGLAVYNHHFDFRPFSGNNTHSERMASLYAEKTKLTELDISVIDKLKAVNAKIYTPKSNKGIQIGLMPDLKAVKNFNSISIDNPTIVADLVEPISESIVQLAGISGAKKEKAQSLISSIIVHYWKSGKDLNFELLIGEMINPSFDSIGYLPINEFLKENERKIIAASVNLILSSPAKSAWMHGEKLNVAEMLQKSKLSIFDMRFTGSNQDKQFVLEQVLSQIYLFLIQKGGSDRLKYILYIDELAGLLPLPPANPPCKKLLELLVRQARAFGLGIIVATQSPGDIDYRIFGNFGTRLIGKLRTEMEIEKVASAMNLTTSKLKEQVAILLTGDFVYNDAIRNKNRIISARWLATYHAGPLTEEAIGWVNKPESKPAVSGSLKIIIPKKKKVSHQKEKEYKSSKSIIRAVAQKPKVQKKTSKKAKAAVNYKRGSLKGLISTIKKYAHTVKVMNTIQQSDEYTPHLKVVIEPHKFKSLKINMQGPYFFDLTSKIIRLENYLKGTTLRTMMDPNPKIFTPKTSIKDSINYAIDDALPKLKCTYYSSKLIPMDDFDIESVERANYEYLIWKSKPRINLLNAKTQKSVSGLNAKIRDRAKKRKRLGVILRVDKTKRFMKNIFSKKKLQTKIKQHNVIKRRIKHLDREIASLNNRLKNIRKRNSKEKGMIEQNIYVKSHAQIKECLAKFKRRDVIVHATLILIGKSPKQF